MNNSSSFDTRQLNVILAQPGLKDEYSLAMSSNNLSYTVEPSEIMQSNHGHIDLQCVNTCFFTVHTYH